MQMTIGELRKNFKEALKSLPIEVVDGRRGEVIAVISEPQFAKVNKPIPVVQKHIPGANSAMQDFMAKTARGVGESYDDEARKVMGAPTGKQCELPICRNEAVAQGVWVEYDFESGERRANLWLCQKHLEIGEQNANG